MPPKSYRYEIAEDVFVTVHVENSKNKVTSFVVKLEILLNNILFELVRYDTAHGGVHRDTLLPDGKKHRVTFLHHLDFKSGLDYAIHDVEQNWEFYVERFERWLREKEN